MPHLAELRGVLTWIGITLLPLGLVVAGGRAVLAPSVDGESPSEVFGRVIVAGVALIVYDWAWGAATRLSHLLTDGLLGLPWVTDGVEKMLQTLVIGGAAGSAVASEFVVPLLILVAGTALLALLLVRVGLEVACALLYVLGGLVLGLAATGFGWRLLYGWLVAVTAVFVLPLLWSVVFCTGAALMLDTGSVAGRGGFAAFVAQLYNVAAALAIFWVAIKLAQGVFRHAGGAVASLASARGAAGAHRGAGGGGVGGAGRARALAENATPAGPGSLLAEPPRRTARRRRRRHARCELPTPAPRRCRTGRQLPDPPASPGHARGRGHTQTRRRRRRQVRRDDTNPRRAAT